jgi:hypothetical protein
MRGRGVVWRGRISPLLTSVAERLDSDTRANRENGLENDGRLSVSAQKVRDDTDFAAALDDGPLDKYPT